MDIGKVIEIGERVVEVPDWQKAKPSPTVTPEPQAPAEPARREPVKEPA